VFLETEEPAMRNEKRICLRVEELEGRLVPSTLSYSTNWSGYAVSTSAAAVTQVAGSWIVPTVSNTVSGYSSAWVGIDGYNSSSVEQIGTDSDYVNGVAQYYAWYEFYPHPSVTITSMTVNPGDTISASVTFNGSQFTVSITDGSQSFSTAATVSQAQRSSAEWIQEAPSSGGVLPLANFGTIYFSGANATVSGTTGPADNSWSGSTLYQINMITPKGTLKATTSALSDSGSPPPSSFSVTWGSSGSAGKGGGGHRLSNQPLPDTSEIAFLLSAVAALATSPQGTAPVLVATPSPLAAVPPVTAALPRLLASHGVTAAFGAFEREIDNSGGQLADPANASLGLPLPTDFYLPVAPLPGLPNDGLPILQTDQTQASLPGADLSTASFEGALNSGHEARGSALAGLVLTLALERTRARAADKRVGKRAGLRFVGWVEDVASTSE
jgi:hypothetical protein